MDTALLVALIGTGSTLIAGLLGPMLADTIRHRHARAELLMDRRIAVYGELLTNIAQKADELDYLTRRPGAFLGDTGDTDALFGKVLAVGGKDVMREMTSFVQAVRAFYARAEEVAEAQPNVDDDGNPIDRCPLADEERGELEELSRRTSNLGHKVQDAIRKEIGH